MELLNWEINVDKKRVGSGKRIRVKKGGTVETLWGRKIEMKRDRKRDSFIGKEIKGIKVC